jgi:hypothetical protein
VVLRDIQHEKLSQAVGWWPHCEKCDDMEEGTRITINFDDAKSYLLNDIIPSHVGSDRPLNMRIIPSRLSDLGQEVDFDSNARNENLALGIPKHRPRPLDLLLRLRRLQVLQLGLSPRDLEMVDWISYACWCRVQASWGFITHHCGILERIQTVGRSSEICMGDT